MTQHSTHVDDNPLLALSPFSRFDLIRSDHVVPGIRHLLEELDTELQQLEALAQPTWEGLIEPIEHLNDRLSVTWGVVAHLMGVKNNEALRQAYQAIQHQVVQFSLRLGQSPALYQGLKTLQASPTWHKLDQAQQRIVEALVRDAELSGVGLQGEPRQRFNTVQQELAELSTQFSNHVLDATKGFALMLHSPAEIEGLPPSLLHIAAQAARDAGDSSATADHGPWCITLDYPSYGPFMQHSRRRDLRQRLYRAFITRASTGVNDNTPLIGRILRLRQEQAALLGYPTFADLSLVRKMAPDLATVERLLEELRQVALPGAQQDLDDLKTYARQQQALEANALCHWDTLFWSERLREQRYAFNEEELRAYFPLPRVLDGLFALATRLFGVSVVAADGEVPVWHEDVRFFRVYDEQQQEIAAFYLDPYSRPAEKRGGAWMDACIGRSRLRAAPGTSVRLPVAYLVCNQTPPVNAKPSLMTFSDIKTLFHEFGHGLQHLLTTVDYGLASGINQVEWDAVELPSQFMENWCYHRDTLRGMSAHVETGEPLPDDLYAKICAARTYLSGSFMLRQLHLGFLDLALHHGFAPSASETVFEVQRRIAQQTTVLPPLPEDRFLCSFEHIFAGGYAAGYYSYEWAEVLSADAFAAFEEAGLEDAAAVARIGRQYRNTILALGGSQHPLDVFRAFRGREPTTEALLRHAGLAAVPPHQPMA
ncbi:Oligopeptidase A [Candidatus Entotheonellaceae bacterium PAL068K]